MQGINVRVHNQEKMQGINVRAPGTSHEVRSHVEMKRAKDHLGGGPYSV